MSRNPTTALIEVEAPLSFRPTRIVEADSDESDLPAGVLMRVEGVLGQVDEVNRNGRIYPRKVMSRELRVAGRRFRERDMFNLADHPGWFEGASTTKVAGIQVSATLDEDANDVVGEIDILDTAAGRDMAAIVRAGGALPISQRGFGTTKEDEYRTHDGVDVVARIVQSDYRLEGWDFVLGPSARAGVTGFREDTVELTLEQLKERFPSVYEAAVAEGVATVDVAAAKDAAIAEARETWESEHRVALDLESRLAERDDVEDPVEFVDSADGRVAAAESERDAARTKLAEAEAERDAAVARADRTSGVLSAIREAVGTNSIALRRAIDLAFDAEGRPRMDPEAATAVAEDAAVPEPDGAPPRGAGVVETDDAPSEEDVRELAHVNRLRSRSGLPLLDNLPRASAR